MATLTTRVQFTDIASRKIITQITVINPLNNLRVDVTALWDTGATHSVITPQVVIDLDLKSIAKLTNSSMRGTSDDNKVYPTQFSLSHDLLIERVILAMEDNHVPYGCGAMIGMDIIGLGDFSVCGKDGKICMSFRYPSLHTIDYVQDPGLIILPRP